MSFKQLVMAEYAIVKDLVLQQKEIVENDFLKWSCWCADTPADQELSREFFSRNGGTDLLWDRDRWPSKACWIAPMKELIRLEQISFELGHYIK